MTIEFNSVYSFEKEAMKLNKLYKELNSIYTSFSGYKHSNSLKQFSMRRNITKYKRVSGTAYWTRSMPMAL